MILLLGGEKGGTGKTTIAVNLAALAAGDGLSVVLVDTDPQLSATGWAEIRDNEAIAPKIPVVKAFGDLTERLTELSKQFAYVVIDAGGRDSAELRSALVMADKVYSPVRASQFDVGALGRMDLLVNAARQHNRKLRAYAFINCANTNPKVNDTFHAIEYISMLDCFKFSKVIRERAAFRKSGYTGRGIHELTGREYNPIAVEELNYLYREAFDVEVQKTKEC